MGSQEVSTGVRITESNTRRVRYPATGHTEADEITHRSAEARL